MLNEGMVKIDLKFLGRLLTIGIEHMPFEATTKHDVIYAYSFATLNSQYDYCKMFVEIANNSSFKIQGSKRTKTIYCKDIKKLLSTIFAGNRIENIDEIFRIDNNFKEILKESLTKYKLDLFSLYYVDDCRSTTNNDINELIEIITLSNNCCEFRKRYAYDLDTHLWTEAGKNYYKIKMGE